MPLDRKELGRRLKVAREATGLKQEDVAPHLNVSRPTVAQMELGNRSVTGLELNTLSRLYGRNIADFLKDDFTKEDALHVLFRVNPDISGNKSTQIALKESYLHAVEITNLEGILDIDGSIPAVATYKLPAPQNRWAAVKQGERIAEEERRRLGLGSAPIQDVIDVLEHQGVRASMLELPDDVSGLAIYHRDIGYFIAVNKGHHVVRRRFSYVHEYCHVLLDAPENSIVSRLSDRTELHEVRANSFAACFLLPEDGVYKYLEGIGKGRPARAVSEVFDELEPLQARSREVPNARGITISDVARIAYHFKVSRLSTIYRLLNIKTISEAEKGRLLQEENDGEGERVSGALKLREADHGELRDPEHHRLFRLGFEAFRIGRITKAKLVEVAGMVDLAKERVMEIIDATGIIQDDDGADVFLPEGMS